MPDGRPFQNAMDFKRLLMEDQDKIARAFIEQLCTYALRRVLTVDDEDDVRLITEEARKKGYGLRDTIRAVATSAMVRKR